MQLFAKFYLLGKRPVLFIIFLSTNLEITCLFVFWIYINVNTSCVQIAQHRRFNTVQVLCLIFVNISWTFLRSIYSAETCR